MKKIKDFLYMSDLGFKNLGKAIFSCVLSHLVQLLPLAVSVALIVELLVPLSGGEIRWQRLWWLLGIGALLVIAMFFACIYEHRKTFVAAYSESENQRIKVTKRLRKLPMSFFYAKDLAEITTNLMADCASIEKIVSHILPQLIATGISTILICVFLFFVDWRLSLCTVVTIPAALLIIWASRSIHKKWVTRLTDLKLKQEDAVQEYIEGIKVTKSCRSSKKNYNYIDNILSSMKKLMIKGEIVTGSFFTGSKILLQCGTGLTILAGVLLYINGQIAFVPILLFCMISTRIYSPILSQLATLAELMYYRFATERMRQLMSLPTMDSGAESRLADFTIRVEDVCFGYADKQVLNHISITLPKNKITAVVGPSGSGKSTLLNLIMRFWDVSSGRITIGGQDIKDINPEYLMRHISVVFQKVVLFDDTVYNNIRIGNAGASNEQVKEAALIAGCDAFVRELPDGYDTLLGENGSKLSGGERQRISIARAILKDAPIVLLDEATASLDPENEKYVQNGITRLIQGKTVIVVAHKLRTIAGADQIVVIKNGSVDAIGPHEELMRQDGLYRKLYRLQEASLQWSVGTA